MVKECCRKQAVTASDCGGIVAIRSSAPRADHLKPDAAWRLAVAKAVSAVYQSDKDTRRSTVEPPLAPEFDQKTLR
jgi:hypothetical protein